MDTISVIAQFFLCLSILIVLHEGGHYLAARMTGTRVDKFYLFFDFLFPFPDKMNFALWKKKIGNTEYGLGWFPMGGYVAIAGMQDETQDAPDPNRKPLPDEYGAKSRPQKLFIMLGGVIVNFILGFLIYAMILFVWGEEKLPASELNNGVYVDELGEELGIKDGDQILAVGDTPFEYFNPGTIKLVLGIEGGTTITVLRDGKKEVITPSEEAIGKILAYEYKKAAIVGPRVPYIFGEIAKGSPAEAGGFMEGDSIVILDGFATPYKHEFLKKIKCRSKQIINVGYYRQGIDTIQYGAIELSETSTMGVGHKPLSYYFTSKKIEYGFVEAFPAGFYKGLGFIKTQLQAFKQMFSGKIKAQDSLGGFGSIGGLFDPSWDWHTFWSVTAMLSLILAIMNLLPIPLLDGGYVLFLLLEMVTRREIPDRIMNILMNVGLYMILGLMIFANGMDIIRAFSGGVDPCG